MEFLHISTMTRQLSHRSSCFLPLRPAAAETAACLSRWNVMQAGDSQDGDHMGNGTITSISLAISSCHVVALHLPSCSCRTHVQPNAACSCRAWDTR